ncbi:unnamed protein product [Didymodactylos carnosus]|uniref:RIIa domain-containing protein n=1 Tax=Didymodactylos carnosus TaxID=1234261 RepID=A0A814B1I9_9BILA|nr:unnamed protein product [Didymodactylos carnosus]CAF3700973.1 unnamed protein product [Didymodactylos carnosus]
MINRLQRGRTTPLNSTSGGATATASPSTSLHLSAQESDQAFLERLRVKEIISDAILNVARCKPDDPIDFLYNYFDAQCQTKPFDRVLTRLRLADPKHSSFELLLTELYQSLTNVTTDVVLNGDLYNKLIGNLANTITINEHRLSLLANIHLRPNDPVSLNVFSHGIRAILLYKGWYFEGQ